MNPVTQQSLNCYIVDELLCIEHFSPELTKELYLIYVFCILI